MATPLQIQRQFARELQAHQEGISRLRLATTRAEERAYASSSVYGQKLIDQGLGCTIDAIEEKRSKIAAGSTGEFAANVRLLEGVPSATLALITIKTCLDSVFDKRHQRPQGVPLTAVVSLIGNRAYDECLLAQFSEAHPEDFQKTKIHHSKGYSYKVAKYRATMRHVAHEALKWPTGHKVKVGTWLLDRLITATGWFHVKSGFVRKGKQLTTITPAPEVQEFCEAIMLAAEAAATCYWPMLCEPNDWTTDLTQRTGGYLTTELRMAGRGLLIRGVSDAKLSQSFPLLKGQGETATPLHGETGGEGAGATKAASSRSCTAIADVFSSFPLSSPSECSNDAEHVPSGCHPPSPGSPDLRVPVAFLNSIQKVPFQINQAVLDVALRCQEARVSIGSFRQSAPLPLPHKPDPWETATEEERTAYKRGRVQVEEENTLLAQRNYQTTETIHIAKMYRDEDSFWFPWSFDFRGRVYPVSNHLTPQGTDFARSLLVSAYSGPADREWLAFQVATTWGLGKETMQERQDWVNASLGLIQAVAQDPVGTISSWQGADEPWQFLAACIEFHDCFIAKTRDWSNLLVGFDATCSGLQHLAALTRDRGAAELVNVAPTARPADAYKTVAEAAKAYLPEEFHPLITRKVTKRVVMTIPYNLTKRSARDYLRGSLPKGHNIPLDDLTHAVYDLAVPEVLPGPMRAKQWIQKAVDFVANATNKPVVFTSPSGFPVILDKRVYPTELVDTKLLGKRIRLIACDFNAADAPINRRKITIGAMPNYIHSLDAALLHRAFAGWDRPIALIHDCVLTLSCDVEYTRDHVRDCFADLYQENPLQSFSEQLGYPIDDDVMVNTLDIEDIRSSNFLFC